MKTIIHLSYKNPFETYLLVGSIAAGISGILNPNRASSVAVRVLPGWVLSIWYIGLIVGSVLALTGLYSRFLYRLQIELTGLGILSSVSLGFSILLLVVGGRPLAYSVILVLFFSLSCIAKIYHIYKTLRRLRKVSEVIVE